MFSAVDHILGHKTKLNKVKRIDIISSIFSEHNSMKLEISHRKKVRRRKKTTWILNHILLKNSGSSLKSKRKSENTSRQMTMKTPYRIYGMQQKLF